MSRMQKRGTVSFFLFHHAPSLIFSNSVKFTVRFYFLSLIFFKEFSAFHN